MTEARTKEFAEIYDGEEAVEAIDRRVQCLADRTFVGKEIDLDTLSVMLAKGQHTNH